MKNIFIALIFCQAGCMTQKEKISVNSELQNLNDISLLPSYRANTILAEQSTYDRTGGNDDGFSGTYSFVRRNPDSSLVMFDVAGPGVINRFTTPMAAPDDKHDFHLDTLDFFIDDTTKPSLSIRYIDLFSGKVPPFTAPLCGEDLGGNYCYFPITFQQRCRIVYRGKHLQFHQIQYRLFPAGTIVESFHLPLDESARILQTEIGKNWTDESQKNIDTALAAIPYSIKAADSSIVYHMTSGGRINALQLQTADEIDSSIFIRLTWDNEDEPAIYCPLRDLFGYAFGKPAMKSLLLGGDEHNHYFRIPMPFDHEATVTLINHSSTTCSGTLRVASTNKTRESVKEGKLYVRYSSHLLDSTEPFHVFLNVQGKGHYIGTILQAQGIGTDGTPFFEGDDSTVIDQEIRIHGTGSEDYFGGGWYALPGRWDRTHGLPLFGCLDYSWKKSFAGGYRFYLNDKLSFEKSIYQAIEHGPSRSEMPRVHYTSLAFYYSDRERKN
jgi:Protein of unknown function (DUF2961)